MCGERDETREHLTGECKKLKHLRTDEDKFENDSEIEELERKLRLIVREIWKYENIKQIGYELSF